MPDKLCCIVSWAAQVTIQDCMISAARAQEGGIPRHSANAPVVSSHRLNELILGGVPNL